MTDSRTENLVKLQQLTEKRRAMEKEEATLALQMLRDWIRGCQAAAKTAANAEDFDKAMRLNPLPPTMAQAIGWALDANNEGFLWRVRDELQNGSFDFPFPVEVYKAKKHHGAFIITVPNPPLDER